MKRALVFFAAFTVVAAVASAQTPVDDRLLSFRLTGSVITLGDPSAGPFQVMAQYGGKGTAGQITGNGFYFYQQVAASGQMVVAAAQSMIRVEATGDVLLLNVTPGPTGVLSPGPAAGMLVWTQTWHGMVVGGTGRFAGATGTFSKTLTGFLVLPGFVSPFEGTLEVCLDR